MIKSIEILRTIAFNIALFTNHSYAHDMLTAKNFRCIARAAYGEARGEGRDGMALVVQSILNRSKINGHTGCRIAEHAYEGYRAWRGRDIERINRKGWTKARATTLLVMIGGYNLGKCSSVTHFLNPRHTHHTPAWASRKNEVCTLGHHVAYRVANL